MLFYLSAFGRKVSRFMKNLIIVFGWVEAMKSEVERGNYLYLGEIM